MSGSVEFAVEEIAQIVGKLAACYVDLGAGSLGKDRTVLVRQFGNFHALSTQFCAADVIVLFRETPLRPGGSVHRSLKRRARVCIERFEALGIKEDKGNAK